MDSNSSRKNARVIKPGITNSKSTTATVNNTFQSVLCGLVSIRIIPSGAIKRVARRIHHQE